MVERVAILLHLCEPEVAQAVMERVDPAMAEPLRARLEDLRKSPPSPEVVEDVLQEFKRRVAMAQTRPDLRVVPQDDEIAPGEANTAESGDAPADSTNDAEEASTANGESPGEFTITDNPIEDANRLEAFQLASALADEAPLTIGIVVNCLQPERAGALLAELPEELAKQVFVQLPKAPRGDTPVIRRIVAAAVDKAASVRRDPLAAEGEESDRRIAGLLRGLSRNQRTEMLNALETHDAGAAERVRKHLYVFEDLIRIENLSLQKLLRNIELPVLARALSDADDELQECVSSNLASRARAGLAEETDMLGSLSDEERDQARDTIVAEIARMDSEGQLTMK